MNIRSRFAPYAHCCDQAEPPSVRESRRNNLKNSLRLALAASLSVVGLTSTAHAQNVQVRTTRGVTTAKAGELLVKFGSSSSNSLISIHSNISSIRAKAAPTNKIIGAIELQSFGSIGWQLVKLPTGMSLEDGIKFYKSQANVLDVEPNPVVHAMAVPNDPAYSQQYGLEKIGAPAAWNKNKGSASTIVAVIDTGVNYTHEDLSANMWKNPKEIPGNGKDDDGNGYIDDVYGVDTVDKDGDPMDSHHHGTHCAGIIGAAGNNGIGISGVNWNVKIMACKVLGADGSGSVAGIIEGLQYVLTMKARGNNIRVVNESLGGPGYSQATKDVIDALGKEGVFVAAAAGNETTNNDATPSYPASYDCPNIISVAASDSRDNVASFSNYGATSVDLAAPGVDIYSTFWPGNSSYANSSGTSMATPMVAGAAALLYAFNPSLTPEAMKKLLMDTVDPLPQWDGKVVTGGRMNLARALTSIDPNGLPIVTSTSPRGVSSNLRPAITVSFSKPMNQASVQSNWSFAPAVTGTFVWSNNNQTVTFAPSGNLVAGTMYEGRIKGTAVSAAGVKLDGDLSGASTGSPSDDYVWNFRIVGAPSNDNFARAMPLSGDSGYVPAFNMGATREAGEGRHGNYYGQGDKSVWFKWTAPATGNLIFDTTGSTFSHVIGVYTGSSVGALTTQKLGDSNYIHNEVQIALRVVAGTTYSIVIDGDFYPQTETTLPFTDTGNIRLSWLLYRSPANDNYASAQNISGVKGSTTGNTLGAYWEDGETSHAGADSSVWFRWTAPANGAVTFDTIGTNWDTELSAFTGTPIRTAKEVAQDRDGGGANGTSLMPFTVSAGATYYISVGGAGYAFNDARGDFKLNWNFVNAPTNDAFSKAIALNPANGGTLTTSTYGATLEANEPEVEYDEGIASIWYTWTAPTDGAVSFDTLGSSFNTNLGVYTGNTLSGLTVVAENDDNKSVEETETSKVKFTAVKGTTYRIRIDSPEYASSEASIGYPATHGPVRLTWSFVGAPSNDRFASAQLLNTTNGGVVGSNIGANIEIDEPKPNYRDEGASIWYKWTAPTNGAVTFDLAGSTYINGLPMNTYLAIYTGSDLASLEVADENDDDKSNEPTETSRVRFTVKGGTTYYVRIDNADIAYGDSGQSYDRTHGSIALAWDFVGAPANDNFSAYENLGSGASGRVGGTTVGAGLEANEENPTYRDDGTSLWYRWTAPYTGTVMFSTSGSKGLDGKAYDTHLAVYTGNLIDGLEWVNENNDDGSSPTSKVTFDAEAGTTYVIRVGDGWASGYDSVQKYNSGHGVVSLSWSLGGTPISGPTISNFTPTSGGAGTVVTINGTNLSGANSVLFDGLAGTISTTSATSVKATAPTGVHTGRITIKTGNGSAISDTDFKVGPAITTFSPTSGPVGTQITIEGSGFQGVTGVTIGGASASFTVVSATRLTAIVPGNAVSGKVTVTTAGGTAASAGVFSMPPRIDSFSPPSGLVGTRVQIKGANFLGTTSVLFNTTAATAPSIASDVISVAVPAGATTGLISVVTPAGTVKTATNFVVQTPPVITGFTPLGGKTGTAVTISGRNFLGATAVRFNGVAAVNPKITATLIAANVPAGALTGPISVTTPEGDSQSAANFVVDNEAPTVTITNPMAGSSVTALPKAFTGTVGDNGGVSNVQSVTWLLARTIGTNQFQYWNPTNGIWGAFLLNASTPTRPNVNTAWSSVGNLPTGANLTPGAYTVRATATDKMGNESTVFSAFTVAPLTYSISGRITLGTAGLANVTVTRTGNVKVVTNANGEFSFAGVAANTNVTLTPTLTGYTFNPVTRNVALKTANVTGQNFAATSTTPTVTSFTPASGPVGTAVTIKGTNLSTATAVKFNNVTATIKSKAATQIVAVVPAGATTGRISVTTPTGTTSSTTNFTVTIPPPTIAGFTPGSGQIGFNVTINGTNLAAATSVKFNNVAAVIKSKTATQIVTSVPAGATTGRLTVTTPTGTVTSAATFTVILPPTIANFTPGSGQVGFNVTIDGTNLSTATAVKFNNVAAVIKSKTATQIVTSVPTGATTGRITVTTPNGTATSTANFTVTVPNTSPTIASFTPTMGPVGTAVTINGTNMATVTSVKFNNVVAVIKSKTATQVMAVVPTGATTGRISVTSGTGTATSTTNFTVKAGLKAASAPSSDEVVFCTPAANATYPALDSVRGTTADAGQSVYLQLYKVGVDGKTLAAVYDWTNGSWGGNDKLESTIAKAMGTTEWQLALPQLPAGSYEIYAAALSSGESPIQGQWLRRRFTISAAKDSVKTS
ncbi:hypothetical protein EON83_07475 [bacterium]|nr:MAG: hypothetical protein EON83_07475 [bacterium]